jgi:hypothetical protein
VGDIRTLVRSLREFEASDVLIKEVRKKLREPVDPVRRRIKATARGTLPATGGLGEWVAGVTITATVTLGGRAAGIRLRGGRNSLGSARSDIRAIDRGRLRHPTFGRRHRGMWFTQSVLPGFFTKTASEAPEWGTAIDEAIAIATSKIHA